MPNKQRKRGQSVYFSWFTPSCFVKYMWESLYAKGSITQEVDCRIDESSHSAQFKPQRKFHTIRDTSIHVVSVYPVHHYRSYQHVCTYTGVYSYMPHIALTQMVRFMTMEETRHQIHNLNYKIRYYSPRRICRSTSVTLESRNFSTLLAAGRAYFSFGGILLLVRPKSLDARRSYDCLTHTT